MVAVWPLQPQFEYVTVDLGSHVTTLLAVMQSERPKRSRTRTGCRTCRRAGYKCGEAGAAMPWL